MTDPAVDQAAESTTGTADPQASPETGRQIINNSGIGFDPPRQIDGLDVVSIEVAYWMLPAVKGGEPVPRKMERIVRAILADGSERFVCVDCGYAKPHLSSIPPHQKTHTPPKVEVSNGAQSYRHRDLVVSPDLTLGELFAQYRRAEGLAAQLERMVDSRNEWREKAQEAERQLAQIRKFAQFLNNS